MSELMDSTLYLLFPNFAPWAGHGTVISYRHRPNGDDVDSCIMDIYLLTRTHEARRVFAYVLANFSACRLTQPQSQCRSKTLLSPPNSKCLFLRFLGRVFVETSTQKPIKNIAITMIKRFAQRSNAAVHKTAEYYHMSHTNSALKKCLRAQNRPRIFGDLSTESAT